ncbi:hypothetical protein T310_10172, partial [Rasamsonia emersonii CBS 393.64]
LVPIQLARVRGTLNQKRVPICQQNGSRPCPRESYKRPTVLPILCSGRSDTHIHAALRIATPSPTAEIMQRLCSSPFFFLAALSCNPSYAHHRGASQDVNYGQIFASPATSHGLL